MAVNLSPYGGVGAQFLDNSGNVLTGGKIFTYAAGTTTNQVTYTTSAGNIPHSNPIILDASGRVPSGGEIWLTDGSAYKFILRDSNDVLIATYDNVTGINSNFVAFTNQQEIQTATAGQTVFNLTTTTYQPGTNSLSVFVDGVNQYGPGAQYAYLETDADTVTFVNGLHVGAEVKFTTSQLNSSGLQANAFQVSYTPPFTGSVGTNVGDKLAQTVSVMDFGAVGDGVTDDTVAIQTALDYWIANPCDLLFPAETAFLVSSPLVATFSTTSQSRKRLTGYGAEINGATVSGDVLKLTVTGAGTLVRNIIIEGIYIRGNNAAGYALTMQGPLAGNSFFYNNVLRDVVTSGFGGIALLGNFFESTVQDCHVTCPISATSGYGIFIDTAGGSGSGSGGVISSLTLFQNTTRGGINGVYSSATSADVNIINGTYLQAWEYGIQIALAQGGYIKGAHVEANWQSTSSPAPGQAGIRAIITGNFTIENTYAVLSGGQTNSARVFMGVGSCANLVGGYQFGGNEMFRIESGVGGTATAIVSGAASISTDGNARITQLDGLRVRVPIASGRVVRINSSSGNVTPDSLNNVYNIRLTTNPTINLPSFTAAEGDELEFCFEQAGSGGNTVTWAVGYLQGSFVPTSAFGSISTIRFRYISRFASSNALFWTVISTGTT